MNPIGACFRSREGAYAAKFGEKRKKMTTSNTLREGEGGKTPSGKKGQYLSLRSKGDAAPVLEAEGKKISYLGERWSSRKASQPWNPP